MALPAVATMLRASPRKRTARFPCPSKGPKHPRRLTPPSSGLQCPALGERCFSSLSPSFRMRNRIAHHGQPLPAQDAGSYSRTETETRTMLAQSPDGRIEEWISSVRRSIELIVIGRYLLIRQRIQITISVRRLMHDVLEPAWLPQGTRRRALPQSADAFREMKRRALAELDDEPRGIPALAA